MFIDEFWHRRLGRPYLLAKRSDVGKGTPVVLLHGIGRSGEVWQPLVKRLHGESFRLVAFDLLGFGDSPKPAWPSYDIDTHARVVIANIRRQRFGEPVLLVGHSLGALVALRVAYLRPDLVKHVILYEMPLYEGLPEKRHYAARLKAYFAFYQWVLKQDPTFGEAKQRFRERLATRVVGAELTRETWLPFIKSLENSIMKQTAATDIRELKMPADVIYGSRDMLVIRGKVATIFGADAAHITAHTIKARHRITKVTANFLAERLEAAERGL
ncbi:MAG TPA: alpha/beta hydrolase [Candidatus Saccharimonadales bacterium]